MKAFSLLNYILHTFLYIWTHLIKYLVDISYNNFDLKYEQ